MPDVVRYPVDICTGHDCWPPRNNAQGSDDVYVDGYAVHRLGDLWQPHCCLLACHDAVLSQGSSGFTVNGRDVGYVGAAISCGSFCATGSSTMTTGI